MDNPNCHHHRHHHRHSWIDSALLPGCSFLPLREPLGNSFWLRLKLLPGFHLLSLRYHRLIIIRKTKC
nr:MAG TPA_asm: DNA ligase [Caudoviricetes sp.]